MLLLVGCVESFDANSTDISRCSDGALAIWSGCTEGRRVRGARGAVVRCCCQLVALSVSLTAEPALYVAWPRKIMLLMLVLMLMMMMMMMMNDE